MTTNDTIQPEQAQQILQTIAVNNPDYYAFRANYANAVITDKTLPPELLLDTLSALEEDPNMSALIEAMLKTQKAEKSFSSGGEVAIFITVFFLLRTHIKLKRNTSGKWELIIEHKPGDSKLMSRVLKKLEEWVGGDGLS